MRLCSSAMYVVLLPLRIFALVGILVIIATILPVFGDFTIFIIRYGTR